jgi:hypothetical protein
MTETTSACVRGCAILRQHLSDCEDREYCRGCLPRRADHGRLCHSCHRRFELMLHDAPTVHRWLTANLESSGSAIDENGKVTGGGDGWPAPLSAAILDVRDLLADGLAEWTDDLCETYTLGGPDRHTVEADAGFLRVWLTTVERLEWVGDWWEWLAERFSEAHALAPWRPVMRRVPGVACPGCGETNLAIFGGESDITCLSCKIVMTEQRFGLWERVLRMEVVA